MKQTEAEKKKTTSNHNQVAISYYERLSCYNILYSRPCLSLKRKLIITEDTQGLKHILNEKQKSGEKSPQCSCQTELGEDGICGCSCRLSLRTWSYLWSCISFSSNMIGLQFFIHAGFCFCASLLPHLIFMVGKDINHINRWEFAILVNKLINRIIYCVRLPSFPSSPSTNEDNY